MKAQPGEKITIKINGKKVETWIDENGTQRFPNNKVIRFLIEGKINEVFKMAAMGMFSKDDLRLIYQNNGYDMCGYEELFPDDDIENPLCNK